MSTTICLFPAGTLGYPAGGGYLWIYLNWALGLRSLGCRVIWLEGVEPNARPSEVRRRSRELRERLRPYGLDQTLALCRFDGAELAREALDGCLDLDAATEADLLLNQRYGAPAALLRRFRRSALLDIDPGLLQTWMSKRWIDVQPHDAYFTIGEGIGAAGSPVARAGVEWQPTRPCVALDFWSPERAGANPAFTTLAHWYASGGASDAADAYADDKRSGFLPYLDLPRQTESPLELALDLPLEARECSELRERGWRVERAESVAATPWEFQRYVRCSLGEFSCAKPSYVRLATGWLSDRTVCYLASGKPAVVEDTGPSSLPPDAGLFRFQGPAQAARCLTQVASNYEREARNARALAEEYFDARKVAASVLERALA